MRAAVFVGVDRDLEVTDLEPIAPGPSDVVIDIGAAGVCHSDLSVVTGARPFPAPALLGHEAPGTVVDVGPEVRAVGVGVNEIPALRDCLADAHLDCCLLANQLTLLNQPASDEVFAECARRGVQLIAGGVYNSGVLAGGDRYIYREAPDDVVRRVGELRAVCDRHRVPLKAVAMQFVTRSRHFACVMLGARSLAELDDSLAMANLPLPGELWDELVHRGLIDDAWLPARHEGAIW